MEIKTSDFVVDAPPSDTSAVSAMVKAREREKHVFLQRIQKVLLVSDFDFQLGRISDGYVLLEEPAGWVVCKVVGFRVVDCGYFTTHGHALRFLFLKISGFKDLAVRWKKDEDYFSDRT